MSTDETYETVDVIVPSVLETYQDRNASAVARRKHRELALLQLKHRQQADCRLPVAELGYPDPASARRHHEALTRRVDADTAAGATRHQRVSWTKRRLPLAVAMVDFLVLFTFTAYIFNVPIPPVFGSVRTWEAAALAFIATGAGYLWLSMTGDRLKMFKGRMGEVLWRLTCSTTRVLLGASLVLVGTVAVLMDIRVLSAVQGLAELPPPVSQVVAAAFAVLAAIGNLGVIAVHALDGSPEADLCRRLGKALGKHEETVRAYQRQVLSVDPGADS